MQIICTSVSAAAHVLAFLLATHRQPVRDFEIHPILSTTPPTTYTLYRALTNEQVSQIRAFVDTTVL